MIHRMRIWVSFVPFFDINSIIDIKIDNGSSISASVASITKT